MFITYNCKTTVLAVAKRNQHSRIAYSYTVQAG